MQTEIKKTKKDRILSFFKESEESNDMIAYLCNTSLSYVIKLEKEYIKQLNKLK
jgi:DNA-directed RNA polymerase specialized sigma subunit